ncbi:MAG: hypothetical protein ACOYLQ_19755 [Hyphomicrobiaceae bacterium]
MAKSTRRGSGGWLGAIFRFIFGQRTQRRMRPSLENDVYLPEYVLPEIRLPEFRLPELALADFGFEARTPQVAGFLMRREPVDFKLPARLHSAAALNQPRAMVPAERSARAPATARGGSRPQRAKTTRAPATRKAIPAHRTGRRKPRSRH